MIPTDSLDDINTAFSRQSEGYDAYDQSNPILLWMRQRVYNHVFEFLKPGERVLEINAGTGIDAVRFAQYGCTVHATDLSEGMIRQMRKKITAAKLENSITTEQLSYTELNRISNGPFDYIFSNFGGLNCAPNLRLVTQHIDDLLKPGGRLTWVIMPKISPWEIAAALKGHLRYAFRRLHRGGARAHVEGIYFQCYYFNVSDVQKALGDRYQLCQSEGLGALVPPPHRMDFAVSHPDIYAYLKRAEERYSTSWLLNHWADHVIWTFQKKTKNVS